MRSEKEMLDLILEVAGKDERVRAVILNGSRVNPNAPRDFFQDFDVVYIVTEVASFRKDPCWIQCFGEMMILQMPEDMQEPPPGVDGPFTYLMQFSDGNRIDLRIQPLTNLREVVTDSLGQLLLDKDGIIPPFASPSERDYFPKPPTAKDFFNCCNEFWWVSAYVAKGLWRDEILYARTMMDSIIREELMKMLYWQIGVTTGFAKNPGKFGKYFRKYLKPEWWEMLQKTFADADIQHTWEALFHMCDLFRAAALAVAKHYDYDYLLKEDQKVSAHLRHVRNLPRDAKEMY